MFLKRNITRVLIATFILLSLHFSSILISAHENNDIIAKDYKVSIKHEPLSPLAGEEVKVTFELETQGGIKPANFNGKFIIKKETSLENKVIYQKAAQTDANGVAGIRYKFSEEGYYDIEYIWGDDPEKDSAGVLLQVREATSFFAKDELIKRMWVFTLIAFIGFILGVTLAFILLTMTFHPKK